MGVALVALHMPSGPVSPTAVVLNAGCPIERSADEKPEAQWSRPSRVIGSEAGVPALRTVFGVRPKSPIQTTSTRLPAAWRFLAICANAGATVAPQLSETPS